MPNLILSENEQSNCSLTGKEFADDVAEAVERGCELDERNWHPPIDEIVRDYLAEEFEGKTVFIIDNDKLPRDESHPLDRIAKLKRRILGDW